MACKVDQRPYSFDLKHCIDFNYRVQGQFCHAYRCPRVSAPVTEYRHQEIGGAIHHLCQRRVASLRVDEAAKSYTLNDAIKIAHDALELREQVDRTQSGRFASMHIGHIPSQLAAMSIGNLAVRAEAQLPRHKHEIARSSGRQVVRNRCHRIRQHYPKIAERVFSASHVQFLGYDAQLVTCQCVARDVYVQAHMNMVEPFGMIAGRVSTVPELRRRMSGRRIGSQPMSVPSMCPAFQMQSIARHGKTEAEVDCCRKKVSLGAETLPGRFRHGTLGRVEQVEYANGHDE